MKIRLSLAVATALSVFAAPAWADTINYATDTSTTHSIDSLTGNATFGDDMAGMQVTVFFAQGGPQSATWAATGAGAGAASTGDWTLALSGDSFMEAWTLTNVGSNAITGFSIDGFDVAVFDRSLPLLGTPGSGGGQDYFSDSPNDWTIDVTYRGDIAVVGDGSSPYGDLFRFVDVDFGNSSLGSDLSYSFFQDTDSVAVTAVPEPATLTLLGLGLGGAAALRRRRARRAA